MGMSRGTDKPIIQQKSDSSPKLPTEKSSDQTPEAKPQSDPQPTADERPKENGGQKGLEPTRYGDWEKNGRCTDF